MDWVKHTMTTNLVVTHRGTLVAHVVPRNICTSALVRCALRRVILVQRLTALLASDLTSSFACVTNSQAWDQRRDLSAQNQYEKTESNVFNSPFFGRCLAEIACWHF